MRVSQISDASASSNIASPTMKELNNVHNVYEVEVTSL